VPGLRFCDCIGSGVFLDEDESAVRRCAGGGCDIISILGDFWSRDYSSASLIRVFQLIPSNKTCQSLPSKRKQPPHFTADGPNLSATKASVRDIRHQCRFNLGVHPTKKSRHRTS